MTPITRRIGLWLGVGRASKVATMPLLELTLRGTKRELVGLPKRPRLPISAEKTKG